MSRDDQRFDDGWTGEGWLTDRWMDRCCWRIDLLLKDKAKQTLWLNFKLPASVFITSESPRLFVRHFNKKTNKKKLYIFCLEIKDFVFIAWKQQQRLFRCSSCEVTPWWSDDSGNAWNQLSAWGKVTCVCVCDHPGGVTLDCANRLTTGGAVAQYSARGRVGKHAEAWRGASPPISRSEWISG